ncbi:unnamed protein product, partial [Polarella glacialis]
MLWLLWCTAWLGILAAAAGPPHNKQQQPQQQQEQRRQQQAKNNKKQQTLAAAAEPPLGFVAEPGEQHNLTGASAAAGCTRPSLWKVDSAEVARALIRSGYVDLHVGAGRCVRPQARREHGGDGFLAWESLGGDALEPCLPLHSWFSLGGSTGPALGFAGSSQVSSSLSGLALACRSIVNGLAILLSPTGRGQAGQVVSQLRSLAGAVSEAPCGREALVALQEFDASVQVKGRIEATGSAKSGILSPQVASLAAQLELCPLTGSGGPSLQTADARHLQLQSRGKPGPVAHVLSASVVPETAGRDAAKGFMLELLLFVDGASAAGEKCLGRFTVNACRSLPRFPLLAWRCDFRHLLPTAKPRRWSSPAQSVSDYGLEVLLRCKVPPAAIRHLARLRAHSRGRSAQPLLEVALQAEGGTGESWSALTALPLCARRPRAAAVSTPGRRLLWTAWGSPVWDVAGCSQPMYLKRPEHAGLVRQWLAYHQQIGFGRFIIYDVDGSLESAVRPFVTSGFVEYIPRWPQRLSPGLCDDESLRSHTRAWQQCFQTQAEAHCVWNLRGRARWAMLVHSFDAYASAAQPDGLRAGLQPLVDRLEPMRAEIGVLSVLRYDFAAKAPGRRTLRDERRLSVPKRFRWRQSAPPLYAGSARGFVDVSEADLEDSAGALLVNPSNTWSMITHWGRGRPGSVHFMLAPEHLRLNHYVDILGGSVCAAAAESGNPPCNV